MTSEKTDKTSYDVFLSFASEDRSLVDDVSTDLTKVGLRVFDHLKIQTEMWGKSLHEMISNAISVSRGALVFVSAQSAESPSCKAEVAHIARHVRDDPWSMCVLPVRMDKTPIPDFLEETVYLERKGISSINLARAVQRRLREFEEEKVQSITSLSNEELMYRIAGRRDGTALQVLLEREQPWMLSSARRYGATAFDAEDIVMDVWLRVWEHADTFEVSKEDFRSWLHTVLRNVALFYLRRRKKYETLTPEVSEREEQLTTITESVSQLLESLEPEERDLIDRWCLEDTSIREIADDLAAPVSTVRSRFHHVLQRLRTALEEQRMGHKTNE